MSSPKNGQHAEAPAAIAMAPDPSAGCCRPPLGTPDGSDRGEGLSVAQRGGEALDDRCRRLHFGDRTHALAGVHRHRLDVALHARERQVGRVTRDAAGNLLALLGRSPDGGLPAASQRS